MSAALGSWRFGWRQCTDVKCQQFLLCSVVNPGFLNTKICYWLFHSLLSNLVSSPFFSEKACHALCKGCVSMAYLWNKRQHSSQAGVNSLCWESLFSGISRSRTHRRRPSLLRWTGARWACALGIVSSVCLPSPGSTTSSPCPHPAAPAQQGSARACAARSVVWGRGCRRPAMQPHWLWGQGAGSRGCSRSSVREGRGPPGARHRWFQPVPAGSSGPTAGHSWACQPSWCWEEVEDSGMREWSSAWKKWGGEHAVLIFGFVFHYPNLF